MASSSSDGDLTKSKELGRYREGAGSGRPQKGDMRSAAPEEVKVARKCSCCDNQLTKAMAPLVCSCKEEMYCSQDCQLASKHDCHGTQGIRFVQYDDLNQVTKSLLRYQLEENSNGGPSKEKIEKLMKRSDGDQEHMMVLAEAGDPIAAYVVGEAYARRKVTGKGFRMPSKYLDKSFSETNEIGIKWLKVAAEGGVPEGMYQLAMKLNDSYDLITDKRLAHQWMVEAYRTGRMDYLIGLLESDWIGLPREFEILRKGAADKVDTFFWMISPTLSNLLMAARWQEIRDWDGKTAMGEPFFGIGAFKGIMEIFGSDLKKHDDRMSSLVKAKKKGFTIAFISGRPGCSDVTGKVVPKKRNENNTKFLQGVKTQFNPDYQLLIAKATQKSVNLLVESRTMYQVCCRHNEATLETKLEEFQLAGKCQHCRQDALDRLNAVANGLYSISTNMIIPVYGYAARYVNRDGVIIQDIFKAYSKPDVRQVLQCLASNPADLFPAFVAEDQNLYWTIVWYWGSVFRAIQDTCNRSTLEAVYQGLGNNITLARSADASVLAAFPESAAGEWRIACGSEDCPRMDHEVKFNLCRGCKARRYCNEECQRNDWNKHKKFCKAAKVGPQVDPAEAAYVGQ